MKRILLVLGAVVALAGCGGGGGGGSSTPAAPPGNPGGPSGGSTPTPNPAATNAPNTVITIATPGPLAYTQVNTIPASGTQNVTTVGRVSATQNGTAMTPGTALNSIISSSDTSGNTCLVYVPNGSNTGSACTYPAAGSTPAPVSIKADGDGYAVQYNNGPINPAETITINGTNGGSGNTAPAGVTVATPILAMGHTSSNSIAPWGGGIVYNGGTIYFTQNSTISPIGEVAYSNGAAATSVTNMAVVGLTGAPAGGLILGPDGNLWGTEQNATKAFKVSPAGGTATEVSISCPSGSSGGSGSTALGPQTGIATDGTYVYVLCADVATKTDGANDAVNQITPSNDSVSTCLLGSGGGSPGGPFANGATYANGNIYTEVSTGALGSGDGGASSGTWLSIPVNPFSNCASGFATSTSGAFAGDGNLVMMSDGNLYSEADGAMASISFASATAASPRWDGVTNTSPPGGGGLAQDTVLGSKYFFGTASGHDLDVHTAWTGGKDVTENPSNMLALGSGGPAGAPGDCEVAFNAGGGTGLIQLPDGKLAWAHNTLGLTPNSNWLCIADP